MAQKKINGYLIFLNQCLGRGSYGSVYLGQQDGTKNECAIKILQKKAIVHDQYLKAALKSQIQILQMLKSDNIVKVYDVMQSSNHYYIIQQLCDSDLQKYLKDKHKIDQKQAITFLTQICNGFIQLAREGIVHRDLKPANLLIKNGQIKIGDFGFAKKTTSKRMNQTTVGTPLYMPLQILKQQPYTSKCDIWAVGFIFYQMLHGKGPWTAGTQNKLIQNIENLPLQINPGLSPTTKDFLTKCLKIDQGSRLCWDQVFMHPIFEGYFHKYAEQNKHFQDTLKKVMRDLRFKINSKNIDLNRLLNGLGFKNHLQLDYQEFTQFLKHIHPKILKQEIKFFFEKMDLNADGSISIKQLTTEMQKHRINFNKQGEYENNRGAWNEKQIGENIIPADLQQKVKINFLKLHKVLTAKHLTLKQTFNAYDTDKNGQLNIVQFQKIMKRLSTSFTDDQIRTIFSVIDSDRSKTIEFHELNAYFCKVNGLAQGPTVSPQYFAKNDSKERQQ